MARGRKPVPTQLREARGNPGKRALNRDEPQPAVGASSPPAWLSASARARWLTIAPELEQLGILTTIDGGALAAYCQVWARWKEAEEKIIEFGQVIKTPKGYPIQSPYISIANKALSHVRGLEAEFGMTPSSRSRVKVGKGKTPADKQRDRFFGVMGGRR